MSSIKPRFVIWGYGSENLFRGFGTWLQAQGFEVLMLPDERFDRLAELEALTAAPYILLTTAHFGRDTRLMHDFYPAIRIGNEFLDLLHHCPPLLSVYYPHDLATPLVINEPLLLDAFDLVLWPTPFFGYQPRPRKLVEAGWIGSSAHLKPASERQYDSVLLFSDVVHHKQQFGIAGTCDKLAGVLAHISAVKFPFWPGHEEYEAHFRSRGIQVIPAETSAAEVIQDSRLIVSNSVSSISVEAAYLGVPVINLLEPYLPPGLQTQLFGTLPGCVQCRYEDFATHVSAPPQAAAPCVKPFDPQHVLDRILAEAAQITPRKQYRGGITVHHFSVPGIPTDSQPLPPSASTRATETEVQPAASTPEQPSSADPVADAPPVDANPQHLIDCATAQRLLAANELEEAFTLLQGLVQAETTLAEPYRLIARLGLQQGEPAIAEEFLTHACQRELPPAQAHLDLAELLFAAQRYEDALAALSPVLRNNPAQHGAALSQVRRILGAAPELGGIAWARLIGDLKWQHA